MRPVALAVAAFHTPGVLRRRLHARIVHGWRPNPGGCVCTALSDGSALRYRGFGRLS